MCLCSYFVSGRGGHWLNPPASFPPTNKTNGKGKAGRGIGSHTDYGLLVIAAQDEVGGLFVRPPYDGERYANWEKTAAGMKEDDEGWVYVPPVENTFTVFPGEPPSPLSFSSDTQVRSANS